MMVNLHESRDARGECTDDPSGDLGCAALGAPFLFESAGELR
jgi:hypothetical protein